MHKLAVGCLIGIVAGGVILAADAVMRARGDEGFNPLRAVEWKTYDWRLSRTADPAQARKDIALIEIDEYSLRNLEPVAGRWPWPRAVHASLLTYLARTVPALTVYDVNFADADSRVGFEFGGSTISGRESDAALVDAARSSGSLLLVADATFEGDAVNARPVPDAGFRLETPDLLERRTVFPPFDPLAGAVARVGHSLLALDSDGPLRHYVPFIRYGEQAIPALGIAAAAHVLGLGPGDVRIDGDRLMLGDRAMPLSRRRVRSAQGSVDYLWSLVRFRGPALLADGRSRPYPHYSIFDLLYSEEQIRAGQTPSISPEVFRNKLVFVGVTGSGLADVFETPFAGGRMPGVQVHAAVADDILSNRFMREVSPVLQVATAVGLAVAVGVTATLLPAWWASAVTAIVVLLFVAGASSTFAAGYWLNLTRPTVAAALALFGGVAWQYFVEGREKRKVRTLFGRFVSKDVCEQLMANPALARLGGQRRTMTVLFSDLRGFTSLSEQDDPEVIVGMLNEYFSHMVEVVIRHGGTIDKFVGDMVMALFGAPLEDPRHASHAVDAALAMVTELHALNDSWTAQGRPTLDLGIGISTGPMVAGNIGSETIMSYTVIGDAVNLGARLESLNKQYGTRIIISATTRAALSDAYSIRSLGGTTVKGKTEVSEIFEVCVPADALPRG